jgi:hypothetical protein
MSVEEALLLTRIAELEKALRELRDVPFSIEWAAEGGRCAGCWSYQNDGHVDGCQVDKALRQIREALGEA